MAAVAGIARTERGIEPDTAAQNVAAVETAARLAGAATGNTRDVVPTDVC